MRDLINNIDVKRGISPAAAGTDNTAFVSQILDTQGAEGVAFLVICGALTDADATFATLFEDGDDSGLSDHAEVASQYLDGSEALASFDFSADNKVFKIGYVGPKRYVRVTVTPTGNNSGNIFLAGVWLKGRNALRPTANPPA